MFFALTTLKMTKIQFQQKRPSSSLSGPVRTIGAGEIERVMTTTTTSSSPITTKNDDHHDHYRHDEHESESESFVVRNFRTFTSALLHHHHHPSASASDNTTTTKTSTITENDTIAGTRNTDSKSNSNNNTSTSTSSEAEEVEYDATTDLAYHDPSEREGSELVHQALEPEERNAMPDAFMPLRHYRAEKVRMYITADDDRILYSVLYFPCFVVLLSLMLCLCPIHSCPVCQFKETLRKRLTPLNLPCDGEKNSKSIISFRHWRMMTKMTK